MSETVVIYRMGSLGDTVVALPCFHAIRRAYPDHKRVVLTNFPVSSKAAPLAVVLGDGDFIQQAIAYPVGTRNLGKLFNLARELRALKADTLIYMVAGRGLKSINRDLLYFRLCGFKTIIGAPKSAEDDVGGVDGDGVQEPEAERLARCLAELGPIDLQDRNFWDLRLNPAEHARACEALQPLGGRPFIAVNMGGKDLSKDWGEDHWIALFKELAKELSSYGVVFVGAGDDIAQAERISSHWQGLTLNCCGELTPRESGALLSAATLFIGHDSGPMHLAAAMGTTCVALFGSLNRPRKWHPYGESNIVLHDWAGVRRITVAMVRDAVLGALSAKKPY